MKITWHRLNIGRIVQRKSRKRQEITIVKIPLIECLKGDGRQQKIPSTILIIVRHGSRILQSTIGIIRHM